MSLLPKARLELLTLTTACGSHKALSIVLAHSVNARMTNESRFYRIRSLDDQQRVH